MVVIYLILLGLGVFVVGAVILGLWLRKHPSKANAEKSSRMMHFLLFAGLVTPPAIGMFYPGFTHIDALVGVRSLPFRPFFIIAGILLGLPGLYLMGISNKNLRALGSGANAFRLTKRMVDTDIYRYTRNPMSLGYYLLSLSVSFISGSTTVTFGALVGLIPAQMLGLVGAGVKSTY